MWTGNQLGIVAKDNRRNRPGALFTNIGSCPALSREVEIWNSLPARFGSADSTT
jgi:hypothetical protein